MPAWRPQHSYGRQPPRFIHRVSAVRRGGNHTVGVGSDRARGYVFGLAATSLHPLH